MKDNEAANPSKLGEDFFNKQSSLIDKAHAVEKELEVYKKELKTGVKDKEFHEAEQMV